MDDVRTETTDADEVTEIEVRRNGKVSVVVASVSALVSAAYFARALTTGGLLDWALCLVLAALTWAHVFSFLDARVPLLIADSHGARIRLGHTWRGMAWSDLEEVEHLPRRGLLRDGRLVLFPRDLDGELALLGPAGLRHARVATRLHGAPFALPLGLTTRVLGAHGDLAEALATLTRGACEVVEVAPESNESDASDVSELEWNDDDAHDTSDAQDTRDADDTSDTLEPVLVPVASPTPSPLREPVVAVRAELSRERTPRAQDPELTQAMPSVALLADTEAWRSSTVVIDELASVPVVDPVIGPELAAARTRLHLSVDQLAERTRIRPHVIDAIEIDDFAPCGGDFYARGHLRTLARILGVDAAPLLATYDKTYADAPIDPRRVFEAELSTGHHGPIRGTRGGPNWSVLIAAVMIVVLAWSVARLVMDSPSSVPPATPSLANGSAGLTSGGQLAPPVPVVVTAAGGGARVVIRDGSGKVVFTGSMAFGQSRTLQVSPPVRVQSTDGSLEVTVDGQDHGALGSTGEAAQDVFTTR